MAADRLTRAGDTERGLGRSLRVVPAELNYLINPLHPDTARIKVVGRRAFAFDPRVVS